MVIRIIDGLLEMVTIIWDNKQAKKEHGNVRIEKTQFK